LSGKEFAWYIILLLIFGLVFVCYNLISLVALLYKTFLVYMKKLTSRFLTENKSAFIIGSENFIAFALSVCTLATAFASIINLFSTK